MVQILEDRPSFGSQLIKSNMDTGAAMAEALMGEYLNKKEKQRTAEAVSKFTGMDVSGLPEEAQNKIIEQFAKVAGKRQLLQEAFPGTFGSKPTSPMQKTAEKLQGKGSEDSSHPEPSEGGFNLSQMTPEERTKLALIDPNLGRQATEEARLKHKEDVQNQALIDKSYDIHKPYIDDVTNSYKGFETETKPRLLQMQALNDEQLIGPTAAKFLETLGIPLGSLENATNETYAKLSQDLLKGLPETYGNRILKVEVENFLKTIPTLMNSPEGRRMITSNMLQLGKIREAFYKEMRNQQINLLDKNTKFPKDFEQRVFDNVQPHLNKLTNQFVKMSEIKSIPKGSVPFFGPTGEIFFVPKNAVEWAEKNGGERIW